jgi:transcriptional regulator with XRE-family HTH domain
MEAIRIAIGGSIRNQISQEALGELVGFDKYKISRIERGAQELSRAEAIAIAAVDPLNRGPAWLMFGSEGGEGQQGATRPTNGPPKRSGPAEWREVEYLDPHTPTQPSRRKKEPPKKPGRSALAS